MDSRLLTERMVHEALDVLQIDVTKRENGVLVCNGFTSSIFHSSQYVLAFSSTFANGETVPPGVEIVSPGSPIFDAITTLAEQQPDVAFGSRLHQPLVPRPKRVPLHWHNCVVIQENQSLNENLWLIEHYFRVRFFAFSVDERILRVTVDPTTGHVVLVNHEIDQLLDDELADPLVSPPDNIYPSESLQLARRALQVWTDHEAGVIVQDSQRRRKSAEGKMREFYHQRGLERSQLEHRASKGSEQSLGLMKEKHRVEEAEDKDEFDARLNELQSQFQLREVQTQYIATLIVRARRSSRRMTVARGAARGQALAWADAGEMVENAPVCEACFHSSHELEICDQGHIICKPCAQRCGTCHAVICRACELGTCATCGDVSCQACSNQCPCGRCVCSKHTEYCDTHGPFCSQCSPQCTSGNCKQMVCPTCVRDGHVCRRCKRPKCRECVDLHDKCLTLTCHDCQGRTRGVCGLCERMDITCWHCDLPQEKCCTCHKRLCLSCKHESQACGSCSRLICQRHAAEEFHSCVDCDCILCRACAKDPRCRNCEQQHINALQRELLNGLPNAVTVKSFATVLRLSGLKDLGSQLLRCDTLCENEYIDPQFWQESIYALKRTTYKKRYFLARFIEALGPLHLLDTGDLERVLRMG